VPSGYAARAGAAAASWRVCGELRAPPAFTTEALQAVVAYIPLLFAELPVGEVLRYVEGPKQGKSRDGRKGEATPFSAMWEQVEAAISGVVDKTTFADLLRAWQERQNKYVHNWEI